MHLKRTNEITKIKEFVQGSILKALPDGSEKEIIITETNVNKINTEKSFISEPIPVVNKNILRVPKREEESEKINSNFFSQYKNKNESQENDVTADNDDIKIEFIGKKQQREKKEKVDPTVVRSQVIFHSCYTCKKKFNNTNIHFFYTNLCTTCGDYNYSFREMHVDLTGRIAVVTGGRVKIGYYIVLKLLNYGCKVISTTRFPKDALSRFKKEKNYDDFKNNLIIYPIDFRIFESTEKFIKYLNETLPHLDILINNAAQTVRRTTSYYKYLLQIEGAPLEKEEENKIIQNDFISSVASSDSTMLSLFGVRNNNLMKKLGNLKNEKNLPLSVIASQIKIMKEKDGHTTTMKGQDGQPIDFSEEKSSWNLELDEIPFQEFAEVQLINTWTPYYLCVKLKPLMEKSTFKDRYIVNVSSVEGIFNHFKRTTHPHTNMAKAALNMMTRTVGRYYKDNGIYMTAADTGWVSPMNEFNNLFNTNNTKSFEKEYVNVPLDELDGAMRVIHPIIEGVMNKNYMYGYLLKDYKITNW